MAVKQKVSPSGRAVMFWTSPTVRALSTRSTVGFITAWSDRDKSSERQRLSWEKPGFRGHSGLSCVLRGKKKKEAEWKICLAI